jgi:hypothetical protein
LSTARLKWPSTGWSCAELGAGRETTLGNRSTASQRARSGDGGAPSRRARVSAEEKNSAVAGAPRRLNRALKKAEPQNHARLAARPDDPRRAVLSGGRGEQDQNRRFAHRNLTIRASWNHVHGPSIARPRRGLLIDDRAR